MQLTAGNVLLVDGEELQVPFLVWCGERERKPDILISSSLSLSCTSLTLSPYLLQNTKNTIVIFTKMAPRAVAMEFNKNVFIWLNIRVFLILGNFNDGVVLVLSVIK